MAEQYKIHEKAVEAFGIIETTAGTYQVPAATDCVAAISLTGSITDETSAYQYIGNPLSRDEITYLKDSYADFSFETPMQVINNLDTARAVTSVPLQAWLRCCGGNISVSGATGAVTIDNSVAENSTISIAFRKTSVQDAINQKLLRFTYIRGMVDISATLGEIPKLKFTLKGNANVPEQAPLVSSDYGNQKVYVASSVRQQNIVLAEITPYGETFNARSTVSGSPTIAKSGTTATVTLVSHGLVTGQLANISGCTGTDAAFYNGDFVITRLTADTFSYIMQGTPTSAAAGTPVVKKDGYKKVFCFGSLTANNFFGFDYARYLTGCEEGFSKSAVPTDVSVSFLEGQANKFTITTLTHVTNVATAVCVGHGLAVGDSVTISGATGVDAAYYNGTYVVDTVADTSHFTYKMSGTPAGDATGTWNFIDNSLSNFNPEANKQLFFAVQLKFGTQAGRYVTFQWDKLQLANVKDGKIAQFFAKDVTFRNVGVSRIILS